MTAPTPRKRRLRYSANAVVRKEAELLNISPEFSVAFFFNLMNRVVSSAMVNGECWVQGIGTFKRTEYAARRRHNPRTGSIDLIPGGEKVTFHPIKPRKPKAPVKTAEEGPPPRARKRAQPGATSVHRMK
ncbi:HU family DNA-binding protein [Variovorax sp. LjRoot290]|uniref:HU family DNA-binding protein n=1 Tax=Variovorax sp. LjRoot290 TaxID=3342316 RepID=UPI003ECE2E19